MAAAIPCIMVFVGITTTLRSESWAACWAAIIILELFGRTNTFLALALRMAFAMVSMLGFMVWPPEIITPTPAPVNSLSMPSPALTATMAFSVSFFLMFS